LNPRKEHDAQRGARAKPAKPLWAAAACLYALDLLHVGADDLLRYELVERRALLRKHTAKAAPAILYSEHMQGDEGEAMFRHACRLGLEGIVSKRVTSRPV
jgi:ATP-dependent DNA ligase